MRKINSLILVILFLSKTALACSWSPLSFCVTNNERPNDLVVSGKIVKIDTNGINLEIIDVLKGSETRDTIRIWDGTGFECNGWFAMEASGLGTLNDTIIVILPFIDSIENIWEIIGDYRNPVYFGYTPKLDINNGIVEGYITGQQYFDTLLYSMPYIAFKTHMNNNLGDCSGLVGINEVGQSNIVFYTNPVNKTFRIQFQNGDISKRTISVYSLIGEKLKSVANVMENIEIDFSNFSGGLYIVNIIEQDGKQSIIKVLKN